MFDVDLCLLLLQGMYHLPLVFVHTSEAEDGDGERETEDSAAAVNWTPYGNVYYY